MYEFLDKLINLALPKVRDFQGVSIKFDGRGNYNLGIKEWSIFPEADTTAEKVFGMNITIHTSAETDAQAFELLKSFGMPFKKK
jgi:large subunit ribosomal protein L5